MAAPRAKKKAAVKKNAIAPKRSTKEEIQASWEEGYRSFIAAARAELDFLVTDHGFSGPEIQVVPPWCSVDYTKNGAAVKVYSERRGEPSVVVVTTDPPAEYPLHRFMDQLEPATRARIPEARSELLSKTEMDAFLKWYGEFFRRHAKEILGGDA